MSQCHQFYDNGLDMYQVLPRTYIGSVDCFPGDLFIKRWELDLADQTENLSGNVLKPG